MQSRVEQTAGGVVVRMIEGVIHCLVIRDRYGRWGLPKGHLERGESSKQAALREVKEETGLSDLELGLQLGVTDWSFRDKGGVVHKSGTFYLIYSEKGDPMPEFEEGITECVWVPAHEACSKINYQNLHQIVQEAQRVLAGIGLRSKIDGQLKPTLETDKSS